MTGFAALVLSLILMLTGCMNLTMRLQPEDTTVKETHEGYDCVPIVFGIGIGTATIEAALAHGRSIADLRGQKLKRSEIPLVPIRKIRRVQWTDYAFFFGSRCIEVAGEA